MATSANKFPTKQSDDFTLILTNTFKLIGASWAGFLLNLRTYVALFVPFLLIGLLLAAVPIASFSLAELDADKNIENISAITIMASIVAVTGMLILLVIFSVAVTLTILASARGTVVSVKNILNQSFPLFWSALVLGLLTVSAIIIGIIAFIIPGILAAFFLTFSIYVLVDKKVAPIDAIKESYELTKKNWKLVLAYLVVSFVIQIPSMIHDVGNVITVPLTIAYLVMPAILYIRAQKQNPVIQK